MKSLFNILAFCLFTCFAFAQTEPILLKADIKAVTVFLQDAQILRTGKVQIKKGPNTILLEEVSTYVDAKSISVALNEWARVKSVDHKLNYLAEKSLNAENTLLQQRLDSLDLLIRQNNARITVLSEKKSFLNENKRMVGDQGIAIETLQKSLNFYDKSLTEIVSEQLGLQFENEGILAYRAKVSKQLSDARAIKTTPSGQIVLELESQKDGMLEIEINYIVANAGWFPNYEMKVTSTDEDLSLFYFADIYQKTGVDWKDVKLKLSNAKPRQNGDLPQIDTWNLNYPRFSYVSRQPSTNINNVTGRIFSNNGEPLIGVNVIIMGTSIGTVTDIDGKFNLALPRDNKTIEVSYIGYKSQKILINSPEISIKMEVDGSVLNEVVVMGYGGLSNDNLIGRAAGVSSESKERKKIIEQTAMVYNQTSMEFDIKDAKTILSTGKKVNIELGKYALEAKYDYLAMPKIDPAAYLKVSLTDWEDLNMLDGEASLYAGNTFVGRTIIQAENISDTLEISMGIDKGIVLSRKKLKENSQKSFIGKYKTESRNIEISVKNNKQVKSSILLKDQIPVSVNGEITISMKELSGGVLDEKTGLITWELVLSPGENKKVVFSYEVKSPKDEKLMLE